MTVSEIIGRDVNARFGVGFESSPRNLLSLWICTRNLKILTAEQVSAEIIGLANVGNFSGWARVRVVEGRGLNELQISVNDEEQVIIRDREIVQAAGKLVKIEPGEILPIQVKALGMGDYTYTMIVEVFDREGSKLDELVLTLYGSAG